MKTIVIARHVALTLSGLLAVGLLGAQPAHAAKPPLSPVPVMTAKPVHPTTDRNATFEWTPAADTTYTCALDGAAGTPCTAQVTYGPLVDGIHTFVLRAKKRNHRPNAFRYSWRIDGTAPAPPSVAQVPSPTRSSTASISFSSNDPAVVGHECALDGGTFAACTSPYTVTSLTDGTHTASVRALDSSGNRSTSASTSWTVDQTAPENVVLTGLPGVTNRTVPTAQFTAADAASFDCSVDGKPAASCTSPFDVPGVSAEGAHSLTVRAYDAVGNPSQPATALWVLDTTRPATPMIVTGPALRTNQTSASFDITSDSSAVLECSVDAGSWQPCSSPVSLQGVSQGEHTLQVRAADAAGNLSAGTDSATWTVDTTAPAPAVFTGGPPSPSNEVRPVFSFTGTDAGTENFECALDGGPFTTCDSGEWPIGMADVSGDGRHVFLVRAVDAALNASAAVWWAWVMDATPPATPVFSTAPVTTGQDTTAVFSFASEAGVSYLCAVDGGAEQECASPVTLRDVARGAHTFTVVAEDEAHNRSQAAKHDWTVVGEESPTTPVTTTPTTTTADPVVAPAPAAPKRPATTVSITPDPALRGTSTVTFSADVRGVTSASVSLSVAGATGGMATALSCATAAGSPADCVSGAVRTVKVAPVQPLVPGQTYVLSVSSGVVDASGFAAAGAAKSFRASTQEQETSLRAATTWQKGVASSAYGKRYVTDSRAGAAVEMTVRGPRVTWFTMTGPAQGKATVYVDGVRKARIDTYSASTRWKVAKTLKGLGTGTHQLRIVVAGRKSKASKGTAVVVDAVRSGAKLAVNPRSRTSWGLVRSSSASGGSFAVASLKGAATTFAFKGTAVSWVTATSPSMGKAKVYVDGVLKARVDNFAKRSAFGVRRTVTGLSDGNHTVKVVVTGTKRKAARGTDVVIDKWMVG